MSRKRTDPPTRRAERRKLGKDSKGPGSSAARLKSDLHRKAKKLQGADAAYAVSVIESVLDAAAQQGQPTEALEEYLASGALAFKAGALEHQAQAARSDGPLAGAACRSGCAFCCVLPGKDGGVITAYEAKQLHGALVPLAGKPDGRMWRDQACPALDPETLQCRAYDARPLICRAYFSFDVDACEALLHGEDHGGTAVLAAYPRYLSIHALVRRILGVAKAPTYSLARLAAAALAGDSLEDALKTSKHQPAVLPTERERTQQLSGTDAGGG